MNSSILYSLLFSIFCLSIQTVLSASCSRGYYSDADNCYPCTPGTYCPDGFRQLPCNPGEYQDSFTSTSCSTCRDGYFTTESGSIMCEICPMGSMCPNTDRDPISCPAGTYQDSYGSVRCQQCTQGMSKKNNYNLLCDIYFIRILFNIIKFTSMSNLSKGKVTSFQ
jgi:hypothetical protein